MNRYTPIRIVGPHVLAWIKHRRTGVFYLEKPRRSDTVLYEPWGKEHTKNMDTPRKYLSLDPREPDRSRTDIFRDHNCWMCHDGAVPCVQGNPRNCWYPHARND